jgi:hypothetical protein
VRLSRNKPVINGYGQNVQFVFFSKDDQRMGTIFTAAETHQGIVSGASSTFFEQSLELLPVCRLLPRLILTPFKTKAQVTDAFLIE